MNTNHKRKEVRKVTTKKWYTLKEAQRILDLSPVWVRRMTKQGKLGKVSKDVLGRILIDSKEVEKKLKSLEEKRSQKVKSSNNYVPPSLKAVNIIRRAIKLDNKLDKASKDLFLKTLARYEELFKARLEVIRKERGR